MKNNLIELSHYRYAEPFDFHGYNRRAEIRFRASQIRFWVAAAVDLVATLAITGCTIFCCYLAATML